MENLAKIEFYQFYEKYFTDRSHIEHILFAFLDFPK